MLEPEDVYRLCAEMVDCPDACSFYRADLHVHSPASHDFAKDVRDPAVRASLRDMAPDVFVQRLADAGLDLVAISDHNTGKFLDGAIRAAGTLAKRGGHRIEILTSVELTVHPGVHLIAILPGGGTEAVNDLLSELKVGPDARGQETALVDKSVADVAKAVGERGGLTIGAHAWSTNGVIEELAGQSRIRALDALDALEMNAGTADDKVATNIAHARTGLLCKLPVTYGSDSHDLASLGAMWLKMAKPGFTGLRQLVFEPNTRVSRAEPMPPSHPRILGMTVTAGIYGAQCFPLSPHLNVLIGGRGAGKSAVVDLLRFAFNISPQDQADASRLRQRQASFLQGAGQVLIYAVGTDGNHYAIVRSGVYELQKKDIRFLETPKVFQIVAAEAMPRNVAPRDVLPAEFFGQGEVFKLAEATEAQLKLIDDNIDLSGSLDETERFTQVLHTIEGQMTALEASSDALAAEIAQLQHTKEKLAEIDEKLRDPIFAERARWTDEQQYLQRLADWIARARQDLGITLAKVPDLPPQADNWPSKVSVAEARGVVAALVRDAEAATGQLDLAYQRANDGFNTTRERWSIDFQQAEALYRDRLAALGAESLTAAGEEQKSLRKQLNRIEQECIPKHKDNVAALDDLEAKRKSTLDELRSVVGAIAEQRAQAVHALNSQLDRRVRIRLTGNADAELYESVLNQALSGSGMVRREEQLASLCAALRPAELAAAIGASEIATLVQAGVTAGNAAKILALPVEFRRQLERLILDPEVSIELLRDGEAVYTGLSNLSVGEKCSAVLSIALLNKRRPLVIDQPEDDLDHGFVTQSVVESLRAAKPDRQIVAVTHNPNIPVLGDAELIIRVERVPGQELCRVKVSGGLEVPEVTREVQMLEGGPEAFERRRLRYKGRGPLV